MIGKVRTGIGNGNDGRELWQRARMSTSALCALALITFAGCTIGAPASPTASADLMLVSDGFEIYLTEASITPDNLLVLSHVELEDEPTLAMGDIVSYVRETHEITLTSAGYARIHGLQVPTGGRAFMVCVDNQPIYAGAFWAGYSSQSYDGVIIDPIFATLEQPVIRIELGYPGESFFRGEDPRADPEVMRALEQAGKLR